MLIDAEAREAQVFAISTPEDLLTLPAPRLAPARVEVQLAVPGLDQHTVERMQNRLAGAMAACGCREGSLAVLAYLVGMPLLIAMGAISPGSAGAWIALVGGLVAASVVGKVVGLLIAELRLGRIIGEVRQAFERAPKGARQW
jgi:hypothetical protein